MRRLLILLLCLFPALSLALQTNPQVRIETTGGDILIELHPTQAPLTCENFLNYIEKGYYDGTVFHRVIPNFMIQGGGFEVVDGRLVKKPTDPPVRNESQNGLSNTRGTIAMARTRDVHSATSQFYINVADNDGSRGPTAPDLDDPAGGGYTVFGRVYEGMEVADAIVLSAPGSVIIESITLIETVVEGPMASGPLPEPAPISLSSPQIIFSPLFAFLLGSIPFGLIMARSQGINIREHGSGNIGATNVWRTLGKKFGISCLLLDLLKGLIPVVIAVNLIQIAGRDIQLSVPLPEAWTLQFPESKATTAQIIHILTALLAVLGHNYSPWAGFKGGKGIATSAGVLLGLMPVGLLILLVVWLILLFTTRYVSIASIGAALSLPLLTLYGSWHHGRLQDGSWNKPLFAFALIIAALATWKHRSNIKRLIEGTESRFTRKSK